MVNDKSYSLGVPVGQIHGNIRKLARIVTMRAASFYHFQNSHVTLTISASVTIILVFYVPPHTLIEIFIFCPIFNFDFPRKLLIFMAEKLVKFHQKNCKKIFGENLVKMWWFGTFQLLTTLISREKLSKRFLGEKLVKMTKN